MRSKRRGRKRPSRRWDIAALAARGHFGEIRTPLHPRTFNYRPKDGKLQRWTDLGCIAEGRATKWAKERAREVEGGVAGEGSASACIGRRARGGAARDAAGVGWDDESAVVEARRGTGCWGGSMSIFDRRRRRGLLSLARADQEVLSIC